MEDIFKNTIGQLLLCGAIFSIVAVYMHLSPPKKINYIMGYRTPSSMQSQERWDFSQKYSSLQMIKGGLFMILISFTGKLIVLDNDTLEWAGLIITFATIAFIVLSTERAIKKRFAKS